MDISPACLPPVQAPIYEVDRKHQRFKEYMAWRSSMTRQLVYADGFAEWLSQSIRMENNDAWAKHSLYPAFLSWMRETQAGARKCPHGSFPDNFQAWMKGHRW
jgi:hypothetical protein